MGSSKLFKAQCLALPGGVGHPGYSPLSIFKLVKVLPKMSALAFIKLMEMRRSLDVLK